MNLVNRRLKQRRPNADQDEWKQDGVGDIVDLTS